MSWRDRLWTLYCAGAGDARASYGGAVSDDSNAMLDAMAAEIEAAERVAAARLNAVTLNDTAELLECGSDERVSVLMDLVEADNEERDALAAYRALREQRDA